MQITVDHIDDMHFEAQNKEDGKIRMDGSTSIGGLEGGLSPLQLLLAGVGGCSAVDIVGILEKQKQDLKDLKVIVDGDKQSKDSHSEFTKIHLNFIFTGDLEEKKVQRAINLSIDKYCSVSKALEKGSKITHSYEIKSA